MPFYNIALILTPDRYYIHPSKLIKIENSSFFEEREGKTQLAQGVSFR